MGSEIKLTLKVSDDGTLSVLQQAGDKIEDLGRSGEKASGGLGGLVKGAADLYGAFNIIAGSLSTAGGMIGEFNDLGVASLRAKAGFEALGGTASVLQDMQAKTKGLVDDTRLMSAATQALSAGAVQSASQLGELSRIGATLGLTFKGSAEAGIEIFSRDLEMVGNKRGLKELGISATEVEERFKQLQRTMSDQQAWNTAVFEVAGRQADKLSGALTGTGTAAERLGVQFGQFKEQVGENVAKGIEGLIGIFDVTINRQKYLEQAAKDATEALLKEANALGAVGGIDVMYGGKSIRTIRPDTGPADLPGRGGGGAGFSSVTGTESWWDRYATTPGWWDRFSGRAPQTQFASPMALPGMSSEDDRRRAADMAYEISMWKELGRVRSEAGDKLLIGSHTQTELLFTRADQAKDAAETEREYSKELAAQNSLLERQGGDILRQNQYLKDRQSILSGEVGEIGSAMADRRREMQRRGAGAGALEAFDQQSLAAMDAFRIASGAASKEQIAMEHAQAGLHAAFANGKISLDQYIKAMTELGREAAGAKDKAGALYGVLNQALTPPRKGPYFSLPMSLGLPFDDTGGARGEHEDMLGRGGRGGGGDGGLSPIQATAQTVTTLISGIGPLIASLPGQISGPAKAAADSMKPINDAALAAQRNVAAIGSALRGLAGTLTINVGFTGSATNAAGTGSGNPGGGGL